MTLLHDWLREAAARQASDLHLRAGEPPWIRRDGVLLRLPFSTLQPQQLLALLREAMPTRSWVCWRRGRDIDCALACDGLGRVRLHAFRDQHGAAAALRLIAPRVPELEALRAPAPLTELVCSGRGLLLACGPTGSGKSTTLAALLQHRNAHRAGHIVTVEDPVEFVHASRQSLVSQREVGSSCADFATALRAALRQDPDCLLIGELRDLESVRIALSAAETGQLVLATLHAPGAPQAVDRMVEIFPAGERELVREQLAQCLLAIVAQTLLARADGCGRVAAFELMLATPAVRNLIRERRTAQLTTVLQTSAAAGMQTLEQDRQQLQRLGLVAS